MNNKTSPIKDEVFYYVLFFDAHFFEFLADILFDEQFYRYIESQRQIIKYTQRESLIDLFGLDICDESSRKCGICAQLLLSNMSVFSKKFESLRS